MIKKKHAQVSFTNTVPEAFNVPCIPTETTAMDAAMIYNYPLIDSMFSDVSLPERVNCSQ